MALLIEERVHFLIIFSFKLRNSACATTITANSEKSKCAVTWPQCMPLALVVVSVALNFCMANRIGRVR